MFIPRQSVCENQFCSYAAQIATGSEGIGGVVCHAGAVVYLVEGAEGEVSNVKKMVYNSSPFVPFGLAMQKVKTGYHQVHPAGYSMPGDLGSSDIIAQPTYDANMNVIGTKEAPVGVAHLGIWETTHYTCVKTYDGTTSTVTTKMSPGISLYAAADEGKLTNSTSEADDTSGNAGDIATGDRCSTVEVARVVTGASIVKCASTIDGNTQYPIRVKLLI